MKTLLFFLLFTLPVPEGRADSLLVVSWNVENFLDYRTDTTGRYTRKRFYTKCNAIAKTIFLIADKKGRLPDAVALMEVGDRYVLDRLIQVTPLRKLDYGIGHYESPDRRGIDCALLYRRSTLHLNHSERKPLLDSSRAVMRTRDILLAEFDSLAILVNHHPSGAWEKIDGYFSRGAIEVKETVFNDPCLTEPDRSFGGTKPRRAFIGPRWNGGVSDHYPIILEVHY